MVMASDRLWDVMSNEDVGKCVYKKYLNFSRESAKGTSCIVCRESNVEVYLSVMMQVISLIETATLGERDGVSFSA